MKLRSLICVSAVAAASAALALDGANTFARLKVNSNFKDSIIAIPLAVNLFYELVRAYQHLVIIAYVHIINEFHVDYVIFIEAAEILPSVIPALVCQYIKLRGEFLQCLACGIAL